MSTDYTLHIRILSEEEAIREDAEIMEDLAFLWEREDKERDLRESLGFEGRPS